MNHPLTSTFPDGSVNNFAGQGMLQQWWNQLPAGVRLPIWPAIVGALIILSLLMTFHQVVHGAVQQGELLQKFNARHAEATWRCKILSSPGASDSCLSQLSAGISGGAVPSTQTMQLSLK